MDVLLITKITVINCAKFKQKTLGNAFEKETSFDYMLEKHTRISRALLVSKILVIVSSKIMHKNLVGALEYENPINYMSKSYATI